MEFRGAKMNAKVYPVVKINDICEDYQVYIDGQKAELNTARVSAHPINRRWPGHQRQIEQTELINFLSMSLSGKVSFRIIPKIKSETVVVRPKSLGIVPEVKQDGSIEFCLDHPAYFTVEPYGTNHALHIFADEDKTFDCDKEDENVLYFGQGEHDVGLIEMKNNQTLWIDEGAVVYATVSAFQVNNIKIIGHGILDNSRNKEQILFDVNAVGNDADVGNAKRIYPVEIDCCENVEIDGITIRDPLIYNINCCSCKNVFIKNIKAIGDWRFNSDGVHFVNCMNGSLTDSFLRTYDDSICVRGYTTEEKDRLIDAPHFDDCKDIVIKNNVVWNDWGVCVRIGAATLSDQICNVMVEDCDLIHVSSNVMDCFNCDYGDVHDFTYKNINIEFDPIIQTPIFQRSDEEKYEDFPIEPDYVPEIISMQMIHHFEYSDSKYNTEKKVGQIHDIQFENIRIFGRQDVKLSFSGYDKGHPCRNIKIKHLFRNGKKLSPGEIVFQKNEFCDQVTYEE